jgi:hypothetical protein
MTLKGDLQISDVTESWVPRTEDASPKPLTNQILGSTGERISPASGSPNSTRSPSSSSPTTVKVRGERESPTPHTTPPLTGGASVAVPPLTLNTNAPQRTKERSFSDEEATVRVKNTGMLSPTYTPKGVKSAVSPSYGEGKTPSTPSADSSRHSQKIRRWKLGEQIGKGAFGTVYMGMNLSTGALIAVKEILFHRDNVEEIKSLRTEIELLKILSHPNIVCYYGTEVQEERLYIFTEWCPGGSITDMLKKFGALEERIVSIYTKQILDGLKYLHDKDIVHRDMKGANLLVDAMGNVKLADFGASTTTKKLHDKSEVSQLRGMYVS